MPQTKRASRTALSVAVFRAVHRRIDRPVVFDDPFAEAILDETGRFLLEQQTTDPSLPGLRATVTLRARIAEETVAAARRRGTDQVVLLGAGLDTFALRHAGEGLRVFEVDHPASQSWKRALLERGGLLANHEATFVPVDFETDDPRRKLADAGFRFDRPAVFLLLGVAVYVGRPALTETFRLVAETAPTSEIVFDYCLPLDRAPERIRERYEAIAARAGADGEPWLTYFTPTDVAALLREVGFTAIEDFGREALNARWLSGRKDGLAASPLARIVRAANGPQ